MSLKYRSLQILVAIGAAVITTWMISSLSESTLPGGYVHLISAFLFGSTVVLSAVAFGWFFVISLQQLDKTDERNKDIVTIDDVELTLFRSSNRQTQFYSLGEGGKKKIVVIPSKVPSFFQLQAENLGAELYEFILKGENGNHGA